VEGLNGDTALLLWINAHHTAVLDALLVVVMVPGPAATMDAAEAAGAAVGRPAALDRAVVSQLHDLMWSYPTD
jgi:hypothetical protein